ncbi:MAG: 50S ribosomal protein L6 [Patescibacteria group bacterium]
MSRIGKKVIKIPDGVDCAMSDGSFLVKGPKGQLKIQVPAGVKVDIKAAEKEIAISIDNPADGHENALWGLSRQLVANAVEGVQKPFSKSLEFNGVGFRVEVSGKKIKMDVGFSHPVEFTLPEDIDGAVEKQVLTISGIDKQKVGEIAAQIRRVRPPEPYKGKGIKYADEVIRRKAGKAAAK